MEYLLGAERYMAICFAFCAFDHLCRWNSKFLIVHKTYVLFACVESTATLDGASRNQNRYHVITL
jgi:hypothetical protein